MAITVALVIMAARFWIARRGSYLLGLDVASLGTPGHATVLYFYTNSCGACRTEQKPTLQRLVAQDSNVVVREIDAVTERKLAKRFRVLTVPTTVVLDHMGHVVAINNGVADQRTLQEQICPG